MKLTLPTRISPAWGIAISIVFAHSVLMAQSQFENTLIQYNAESVQGYVQPIADLFGTNMNAGFYHSAAIPTAGFHLEFQLIGMGSVVGTDQETYIANAPSGFDPQTFTTATVFGGLGTTVTDASTGLQYRGSDGILNASLFPMAVPQLTVGYVAGTEATIRFIPVPSLSDDKFPETTLFGIGARHSISQYLPVAPLDIAVGVFYNSLTVGDLIDFSSLAFGAQASKSWSVLTLYGGLQWEKSTMNLTFSSSDPLATVQQVNIDLDGDNSVRFTIGSQLSLGFLHLFADANFGSITNFSGGLGIGI